MKQKFSWTQYPLGASGTAGNADVSMRAESYRQQGSRKSQHMMIIAQATERVSPTLALKEGPSSAGRLSFTPQNRLRELPARTTIDSKDERYSYSGLALSVNC